MNLTKEEEARLHFERTNRLFDQYEAYMRLPWYKRLWLALLNKDPVDPYR